MISAFQIPIYRAVSSFFCHSEAKRGIRILLWGERILRFAQDDRGRTKQLDKLEFNDIKDAKGRYLILLRQRLNSYNCDTGL